MAVGDLNTVASTADFNLTRDGLIQAALETSRVIAEGESMTPEQLNIGIVRLGLIVREVDQSGNWVWTTEEPAHIPLASGVGVYDVNNGLPNNVSELVSVVYRSADGRDSLPLKILKAEGYESINDKLRNGEPKAVYLTTNSQLERRRLYVWPFLSAVTAQSRVTGTDNNIYKCIYPHTSSPVTSPTIGANYRMVWELGGTGAYTAWASGVAYTCSESLRIVRKRPLYDFDMSTNTPDFPMQWTRLLMLRLAADLADVYGTNQDTLIGKVKGAFTDIFPSTRTMSTDIHNKVKYY